MTSNKLLLRYGVLTVLVIMTVGIYILLTGLSLRQKIQAQLFVEDTRSARVYVSQDCTLNTDKLEFIQDSSTEIVLGVDSIKNEPNQYCVYLTSDIPLDVYLKGNTYVSGFIYLQKKSLLTLVMEKIF